MIPSEAELLISKLIRLSTNCTTPVDDENRVVFLGDDKPAVKEIGERLNQLGGYNLMLTAYKSVPVHDQLELTYAWDGIGGWRV